jgi:hypothetical protein
MAKGSDSNRWWENYLVRYFLPSLAGMLIVYWIGRLAGALPYAPQVLPKDWNSFNTAHLILWLLLGSLYCYIASYPALVFHATRIIDFRNVEGQFATKFPYWLVNPYLSSTAFAIIVGVFALMGGRWRGWGAVAIVFLFSSAQTWRIWRVFSALGRFGLDDLFNAKRDASIAYAYLRTLSDRRGGTGEEVSNGERFEESYERLDGSTAIKDAKDFVDSYRHLREHGNTAFIVLLEIALYWVMVLVLESGNTRPIESGVMFSAVIFLWVLPSVFIHFLAQHLERRFSWFDFSIEDRNRQVGP